jgi:hypothetical protein
MSHSHSTSAHHAPASGTTEPDGVNIKSIVGYAVALAVVTAIAQLAMWLLFNGLSSSTDASYPPPAYPIAADADTRVPPEPRLQGGVRSDNGRLLVEPPDHNPGPKEALLELRVEEDALLNGYHWVDREQNVVRIPIAEAMKLTLQRGLTARAGAASPVSAAQTTPAEQQKEQGK